MTHSDYDCYWKQPEVNWSPYFAQTSDMPMLHLTGWYDACTMGTIDNYLGLSKIKKPPVRPIVGPWTHGANTRSYAGDVEFGAEAAIPDFSAEFHLRWFDHFLKAQSNCAGSHAPVGKVGLAAGIDLWQTAKTALASFEAAKIPHFCEGSREIPGPPCHPERSLPAAGRRKIPIGLP